MRTAGGRADLTASAPSRRNGDWLFLLGCLLIPFENFWFAPSRGWAALAPLVFPLYCAVSWRDLPASLRRLRWVFAVVFGCVLVSTLNWLRFPPDPDIVVDVGRALLLGLSFLVALDVHLRVRARDPGPMLRWLTVAYAVGLAVGLVQLAAVWLGWHDVKVGLADSMRRSALMAGRIQFTFTEPAFLSMHVWGVILPLCVFLRHRREVRWLRAVGAGFVVVGLIGAPSVRFLLDTCVVTWLWLLLVVARRGRRQLALVAVGAVASVALAATVVATNERVQRIVAGGVYADASISARWFRVHATWAGLREDPVAAVTGHGFSNIWVPFRRGFEEARAAYQGRAWDEIDMLETRLPSSLHSMPLRAVAELGVVLALLVAALLYARGHAFPYAVVLFCYVVFDSYAFYTLWIYVYFAKVRQRGAG